MSLTAQFLCTTSPKTAMKETIALSPFVEKQWTKIPFPGGMQKHSAPFISVMPRDPLLLMLFMLLSLKLQFPQFLICLKNTCFPLIHLPSCYWIICYLRVCYWTGQKANHFKSCSINQPIT